MITGALPFPSDAPLAGAILRSRVPVPSPKSLAPDLDPKWERAILRALDPEPTRRFGRASEFVGALRGEATAVTVSLPVMTRRRWIAATLAVLILVAAWAGRREWVRSRNQPSPEAAMMYHKGVDDIHAGAYYAATKALAEAVRNAPHFSLAHARLAEAWIGLDTPEIAGPEMQLARREDLSGITELDRLQVDAVDLTTTNEFDAAARKYEQMRRIAPNDADLDVDLGRAYEKAQHPDKAMESFRRAAEGPSRSAAAWLRLGMLYLNKSDLRNSEMALHQAEQLYALTSNLEGLTEVARWQGTVADYQNNFEEASKFLERALRLASNVQQELNVKLQLANHYYQSGDIPQAERYAREAVETAQNNGIARYAIRGIIQLGNAYRDKRDFSAAEKQYEQALTLARGTGVRRLVAVSLLALASFHSRLGRSEETYREAQEALGFYEPNGNKFESLQCLILVGRSQRDLGDLGGAEQSFQRALEMAESSRNSEWRALAHASLGSVLLAQERFPEALDHFRIQLESSTDDRSRGNAGLQCATTICYGVKSRLSAPTYRIH